MRFVLFVIDDESNSAIPGELEAIDAFNESLRANGHWILAAGIGAPRTATLIDARGEHLQVAKTSLFDAGDFYSGFWLIEATSPDEAQLLAAAGSKACNRRVELRPFLA